MFQNTSQLGAFGEFVYSEFCQSRGLACERTNFCHTDFLVTNGANGEKTYVDVKTSEGRLVAYSGRRYHRAMAYETVIVSQHLVHLIPDKLSPFYCGNSIQIGAAPKLLQQFELNNRKPKKRSFILGDSELDELRALMSQMGYQRVRFVERGDASGKRWTGAVDNLPGSERIVDGADVTIFVQYGCIDFHQTVSKIMIFPHQLIKDGMVPMQIPTKRQRGKGIDRVVNLNEFQNIHPKLIFSNLEELKRLFRNSS